MPSNSYLSWLRLVVRAALGTAILLVGVYLVVWRWIGTSEALALLRGDEIVVVPAAVDVGECLPGDVKEMQFRVKNLSSRPVTLTGLYTSCSCILASSLPVSLEARGTSTLRLTIHASGDGGVFQRQAVLYSDSKVSPQLPIEITGTILQVDDRTELAPIPQQASAHEGPAGS